MHIQKPGIFGILEYSEHSHTWISMCIQTPVIFTKIGKLIVTLEIQNPTNNPGIFTTLTYLKLDTYSESSQRPKVECFAKIVKNYNYFSKVLCLRSLTEFWRICSSLDKYWLTCKLINSYTLHYILDETYSELWLLL